VNNEIKQLLKDGIIRPSRSPYNSPTLVVDKKGTDTFVKETIPDRYPMPRIPMILANLGKTKFFTTLDIKSG